MGSRGLSEEQSQSDSSPSALYINIWVSRILNRRTGTRTQRCMTSKIKIYSLHNNIKHIHP